MSIYEALGLSGNAFAYGVDDLDPGEFINHLGLEDPKPSDGLFRQLLGERGAGKSTHLRYWASKVGGPYYYVPLGERWPDLPLGPIVFWDEANRIPKRLLVNVLRAQAEAGATVVVGTHADLTPVASKVGFRIERIDFGPITVELGLRWANAHVDRVRLVGSDFKIDEGQLRPLLEESDGTLRDLGTILHVWLAKEARRQS